jgi:hypothetical protein
VWHTIQKRGGGEQEVVQTKELNMTKPVFLKVEVTEMNENKPSYSLL